MGLVRKIKSWIVHQNTDLKSNKHRVIVIDDDPYFLELIHSTLKNLGLEVETYDDSEQAQYNLIASRNKEEILCIISDIMMDSIDGLEFFNSVRKQKNLEKTDFLFISAVDESFIQQFVSLNSKVNFLKKPFQPEDLKTYILQLKNKYEKEML